MAAALRILSVNQDRGIGPRRRKGAAVHLRAMRQAFGNLGADVISIDCSEPRALEAALLQAAESGPVHLVYERYALGRSAAARFAQRRAVPYALEVNAPLAEEQARWRGQQESDRDREEDAATFGAAGFVAAVSGVTADYAVARGADPATVEVCPNGIDPALFRPVSRAGGPAENVIPEGAFVLGFHGRERPWHGFDRLVDAAGTLLEQSVPVHVLAIGEGEFEALDRLPPGRRTRLQWMPQADLPAWISRFDALPLSYAADAPCYFSPLKLAEAMACAVTPVVPRLGDLPALVEDGRNGLLYRPGDTGALAAALLRLYRQPELRSRLATAAARTAAGMSWEHIARRVLQRFGLESGGRRAAAGTCRP